MNGFARHTRYGGGSGSLCFSDPIFLSSDLRRSFGNRRIFFQLQKKLKKAKKFFEFNSENLKLYIHHSMKIQSDLSSFKNFEKMIFDEDMSGITLYLARMCWFHHCLEQMDLGVTVQEIRDDLVKFVEYNRDPKIIDYIKDSFLSKLRDDDESEILPESADWLRESRKYRSYNIEVCFPWLVDDKDWEYCLIPPKENSPRVSERRAYLTIKDRGIDTDIPVTEKTRLYKNSVTCLDGELYRRMSRLPFTNEENSKWFSEGRDPIIKYTRVLTFVSPGNIRDTFIPEQSSLVILNEIEELAGRFCEKIPGIRIGKRWVAPPACEQYGMIDTKKFGLTFPHKILHETLRIMEKILSLDLTFYHQCLDNQWVYVDGGAYHLRRGFGLGNLNKLGTLAHYWMLQSAGIDSFVYSDDVLLFLKEDDTDLTVLTSYYEEMDFLVNRKKCYISPYWEFLGESLNELSESHQNAQEFANFANILFNDIVTIDRQMSIEMVRRGALARTVKRSLFFITYSIAPLRDPIKMLLPFQSGGFRFVRNYGNWIEQNSDYPVFSYEPQRPSKKIMEYREREECEFHFFYREVPIGVKGFRRGSDKLIERVTYPYKFLNRLALFKILVGKGYHPTFLLEKGSHLTVNQCMSLVRIRLRSDDPTLSPRFPEYRFERIYRSEESVLRFFSTLTDTPRMLLGEYHRIYRRTFSTKMSGWSPAQFELEIPRILALRTDVQDPIRIRDEYKRYPFTGEEAVKEEDLCEGIYETGIVANYQLCEFEELVDEFDEEGADSVVDWDALDEGDFEEEEAFPDDDLVDI